MYMYEYWIITCMVDYIYMTNLGTA